jgi:hypothetical protein
VLALANNESREKEIDMALRARKPEAIQKRLKMFMFGPAGVGKSTAAIQFPKSYIIDAEKGAENYEKLINKSESVIFQTNGMAEVIQEVRALATDAHEYRTLVIDPVTTLYNDLLDKCEQKVGNEFGRHYGAANKDMKRLANLIMTLDMNVIVTAHAKTEYGDKLQKLGITFDGWKQLDYLFDLVIELAKHGKKRVGRIVKTRIETFPDGESFDWSYEEIAKRYDAATLERQAQRIQLASHDQVKQLRGLLEVVKIEQDAVDKWLSKAGVDTFEDMSADVIGKCIDFAKKKLTVAA